MWDYLVVWVCIALCLGVPGLVWLRYRGYAIRKEYATSEIEREKAEREYAAAQKLRISQLLGEKLSEKQTISARGSRFEAFYDAAKDAVWVSNLGASPYLPAEAIQVAANLIANHGRVAKGDAIGALLGEPGLPLESIEGAVARQVFRRQVGDAVYRRITAISGLLVFLRLADEDAESGFLGPPMNRVTQTIG